MGYEVARFDFDRTSCLSGLVSDSIGVNGTSLLGSLARNQSSTTCPRASGVQRWDENDADRAFYPLVMAEKDMLELKDYFSSGSKSGVSFELWFKPRHFKIQPTTMEPIFTIGTHPFLDGFTFPKSEARTCHGYFDLQLRQVGPYLELEYLTSNDQDPCETMRIPAPAPRLQHIVISLADGLQEVYVDGTHFPDVARKYKPFDPSLLHWNATHQLQFFTDFQIRFWYNELVLPPRTLPFQGRLYRFSIYDTAVSQDFAKLRFSDGLPITPPAAVDINVVVNEDAEAVAGSHPREWYSSERIFQAGDMMSIELEVHNLDAELIKIWKYRNIEPNREVQSSKLYINDLPKHGMLYQTDGAAINVSGTEVTDVYNQLVYLPPKDEHSIDGKPFDFFTYRAMGEDVSNQRSINQDLDAVATIYVTPVNDPPLPVSSTVSVRPISNQSAVSIRLESSDVDAGDKIQTAFITEFPSHGHLHEVLRDGSYGDRIVPNTEHEEAGLDRAHVGYRYTGLEVPISDDSLVATDSFKFAVVDGSGSRSIEGTIDLDVFSSLVAIPSVSMDEITMLEDDPVASPIILRGFDGSGRGRQLTFELTALPQNGMLFDGPKSPPLQVGSRLKNEDGESSMDSAIVYYKSNADFFNSPTLSTAGQAYPESPFRNESFEFRVVTYNDSSVLTGVSSCVDQEVIVRNVNDPPSLSVPDRLLWTGSTFSSFLWDRAECSGRTSEWEQYDASENECQSQLIFNGINVTDKDLDIDFVRVDVNSSQGILSLNTVHLGLAEFASCSGRNQSTWQCKGSGTGDKQMTFLAKPNDINAILNGLVYESLDAGTDLIQISIYDGEGEGCLTGEEHTRNAGLHSIFPTSVHQGCFVVSGSLSIEMLDGTALPETTNFRFENIPLQLWVAVLCSVCSGLLVITIKVRAHARRRRCSDKNNCDDKSIQEEVTGNQEEHTRRERPQGPCLNHQIVRARTRIFHAFKSHKFSRSKPYKMDNAQSKGAKESVSESACNESSSIGHTVERAVKESRDTGFRWTRYTDPSSGDFYYEEKATRRVTWTVPDEEYQIFEEDDNE